MNDCFLAELNKLLCSQKYPVGYGSLLSITKYIFFPRLKKNTCKVHLFMQRGRGSQNTIRQSWGASYVVIKVKKEFLDLMMLEL